MGEENRSHQKPGPRKIILLVIISILPFLISFYLNFNVITAQDVLFPDPFQGPTYRISGTIQVPQVKGTVYLLIIDEAHFKIPQSGIDTCIIKVNAGSLDFEFPEIQEGMYGIRCFQDLNNNEKLDRGLRGPKEPWDLTWKTKERFPPRFQDISFHLQTDTLIHLHLSK